MQSSIGLYYRQFTDRTRGQHKRAWWSRWTSSVQVSPTGLRMLKVKTPIRVGSGLLGLSSCVSILIATPFESHLLHSVTQTDIICTHTPLYSFLFCHLLLWHANAPNENKYILLLSPNRQQGGTFFTVTAYLNNLATEKNVIIIDRVSRTQSLQWNNTAESCTLIPEEAECVLPSIRLTVTAVETSCPVCDTFDDSAGPTCCIRSQWHKEEVLLSIFEVTGDGFKNTKPLSSLQKVRTTFTFNRQKTHKKQEETSKMKSYCSPRNLT